MNCGVSTHAPECLCDVIIAEPVEIMPDLTFASFRHGPSMVAHLDTDDTLDVLDHLARLHDALQVLDPTELDAIESESPNKVVTNFGDAIGFRKPTVSTKGSLAFVRKMANSSLSNGELRAETNRIFGSRITASHMNVMRKRYQGVAL